MQVCMRSDALLHRRTSADRVSSPKRRARPKLCERSFAVCIHLGRRPGFDNGVASAGVRHPLHARAEGPSRLMVYKRGRTRSGGPPRTLGLTTAGARTAREEVRHMADMDPFDRILGDLTGLPGHLYSRPATVATTIPILGSAQTYVL